MRNFSWKYFTLTGDVESFMLYKEMAQVGAESSFTESVEDTDELAVMEMEDASG